MLIKTNFNHKKKRLIDHFRKGSKKSLKVEPLSKQNKNKYIPISLEQERLWFLFKLEGNISKFHIPYVGKISGEVNHSALQFAFTEVVKRHEALRTCFVEKDNKVFQYINERTEVAITHHNSLDEEQEYSSKHKNLIQKDILKPFDLQKGPLIRMDLYHINKNEAILALVVHHIIFDGWSLDIVLSELMYFYNTKLTNTPSTLPEPKLQYADYSIWQRQWLQGGLLEKQLAYWEIKLKSTSILNLPLDKPRPPVQTFEGGLVFFKIDETLAYKLKQLGIKYNATLFMVLVAVYKLLLSSYSNQTDICVGTTLANRNQQETENIVGFFANLLVLRTDFNGVSCFYDLISAVKKTILEAYDNKDASFHQVVERVQPVRDQSRSPLFQVNFILQNTQEIARHLTQDKDFKKNFENLYLEAQNDLYKISQYDISLFLEDSSNKLDGYVVYNTNLFKESTIKLFIEQYIAFLKAIVSEPSKPLFSLQNIPESHYIQLQKWQEGAATQTIERSIHEEFLLQTKSTPYHIAIKMGNKKLTYMELNEQANKLAHHMHMRGINKGSLVGICLDRSVEMIIAILSILKVGCAYVPLDPDSPAERLALLLDDTAIPAIITDNKCIEKLPTFHLNFIDIINLNDDASSIASQSHLELHVNSSPLDLAYLIYTSGTTRKPKGVLVSHQSVIRLVKQVNYIHITDMDIFLQISHVSFDASVFEIWGALLNGACLVLPPHGLQALDKIGKIISSEGITILWLTSGLFNAVVDSHLNDISNIRYLLCGGDVLSVNHVNKALAVLKKGSIINGYGPTETTTFACTYTAHLGGKHNNTIPIGAPINHTNVYVLDKELNLLPIGSIGELFIAGKGLAYGYLNNPDLTAEKFLPNPLSKVGGERIYRTGDLVRWTTDGQLEFIGREDKQIKIRGYRIEPSEIEENLLMHPEIGSAVVVPREFGNNNKCLVAYWTPKSKAESLLTASSLRDFLTERLPSYLIPSVFIKLDQLPLTQNGKVNKEILPAPTEQDFVTSEVLEPNSEDEKLMLKIWKEVLGLTDIHICSNFFELGGDSLRAIQLKVKAQEIGLEFEILQLFQFQTIQELVKVLSNKKNNDLLKPTKEAFSLVSEDDKALLPPGVVDAYPISSLQLGMIYHSEYESYSSLYHDVIEYTINLSFNFKAAESALKYLVERHEILRTSFALIGFSTPLQLVYIEAQMPLYVKDLSHHNENQQKEIIKEDLEKERLNKFDWSKPPFCKLFIYQLNSNDFKIAWSFHHAIIDGWSEAVLTTEFMQLYEALLREQPINLEPISARYSSYILLEQQAMVSLDNKEFWKNQLCGSKSISLSQYDNSFKMQSSNEVDYYKINIADQVSEDLNHLARKLNLPLKTILLSAHLKAISVLSNSLDVTTGVVTNVRPEIKESEKMVGLFLNSLPFRATLHENQTWENLITQIFSIEREVFSHKYYPLHSIMQDCGGGVLFEILFNYTHFHVYASLNKGISNNILTRDGYAANSFSLLADFSISPINKNLSAMLCYNKNSYSEEIIRKIANCYEKIFAEITTNLKQFHFHLSYSNFEPNVISNQKIIDKIDYEDSNTLYEQQNLVNIKEAYNEYVKPETPQEIKIAEIWSNVLKTNNFGVLDNFFEIGGHSLYIIQVHSHIKKLVPSITIADLFKYPTIRSLSEFLDKNNYNNSWYEAIKKRNSKRIVSLIKSSTDIAVIGVAGSFPGAQNIQEYWENLSKSQESIIHFSKEELVKLGVDKSIIDNSNYVPAHGVLNDIDKFDANFFGFTPKEAKVMDPQQRLLLETVYAALEDAGYVSNKYKDRIGVYVGTSINSYMLYNSPWSKDPNNSSDLFQAMITNQVATQISHKLNLRGPSINVNTACSTSLVAVHLACKSLINFECEISVAGGAGINCNPLPGYIYQEGGVMSTDGQCRAFDERATGTIGGNGVGVVVLKRLVDALNDGDNIYAVIKGSAINNDGSSKVGYTAPSVQGQSEVIAEAQAIAKVSAKTISYVEAHGTGTSLGDPIEIAALTAAFRASTDKKSFCAIGSVKTNIGHLDAAAGIAGLIKTILSLKYKQILPSLHYKSANPQIDFDNSPFFVNTKLQDWQTEGNSPRRAGVSSFGIGGTNAHIVLEEAPAQLSTPSLRSHHLLNFSAKTIPALEQFRSNLLNTLKKNPDFDIADIAYTLQLGRESFNNRSCIVCHDITSAVNAIELGNFANFSLSENKQPNVVFMFPGQGVQHINMALEIYQSEPIFIKTMNDCAKILQPLLDINIIEVLYPPDNDSIKAESLINQTWLTQPILFSIEYSLASLWQTLGVNPSAMIGHSLGEYVAACVAGVLSLTDALKIVAHRGRLMQSLSYGKMLVVFTGIQDLSPLLCKNCSVAAINTPLSCVISGEEFALENLRLNLIKKQIESQYLNTSHAFHSHMMEPILDEYEDLLSKVKFHSPVIPYISNVTGEFISEEQATSPSYWRQHLRNTVNFAKGLESLIAQPGQIFLEVGPGQTLHKFVKNNPKASRSQIIRSLPTHKNEQNSAYHLMKAVGELWQLGCSINWRAFYDNEKRIRKSLPSYSFERESYWIIAASDNQGINNINSAGFEQVSTLSLDGPQVVNHLRPLLQYAYIPPASEIEHRITEIWQHCFGFEQIGLQDDFFDLGGDSLLATQIVSRLRDKFKIQLSVSLLFEYTTISKIANVIRNLINID